MVIETLSSAAAQRATVLNTRLRRPDASATCVPVKTVSQSPSSDRARIVNAPARGDRFPEPGKIRLNKGGISSCRATDPVPECAVSRCHDPFASPGRAHHSRPTDPIPPRPRCAALRPADMQ